MCMLSPVVDIDHNTSRFRVDITEDYTMSCSVC